MKFFKVIAKKQVIAKKKQKKKRAVIVLFAAFTLYIFLKLSFEVKWVLSKMVAVRIDIFHEDYFIGFVISMFKHTLEMLHNV